MSTAFDNTAPPRFFRPPDATRVRRNLRQIQLQRVGALVRNALFVGVVAAGAIWTYRQTQSDARFAVRHIEIAGAVHTPRAAVEQITRHYAGLNLFKIDIASIQRDLGAVPWVERITIEKKIPDTLRINVIERVPVALVDRSGSLDYVDASGTVVDRLSPAVGDTDLPIISGADGAELARTVAFVQSLRTHDPSVYSRVAEVRPVPPSGFAIFDRQLGTTVYANEGDASEKWRGLYAIVDAEKLSKSEIEYADLRFNGRIVVKPVHPIATGTFQEPHAIPTQITN